MSHEIETMMYSGETPWHGLGTYVGSDNVTSAVALEQSGLDWSVSKQPMFLSDGVAIKTHVAVRRDSDDKVMGIVGSKYAPLQNREAFGFLDSLVTEGEMRYHTAGSLRGGSRVWLLGKIGEHEVVPGDRVDQFVMLYNSHDGSSALRVMWTEVRVVCANTARMALSEAKAGDGVTVRHTVNLEKRVAEASKVLGLAKSAAQVTADFHRSMAKSSLTDARFKDFLTDLLPDRELVEDGSARQNNTRRENVRDEILDLWNGKGIGFDIAGVSGTSWGAYNAVTEYVNHLSTVKQGDGFRFENVMFGTGANLTQKAVKLLSTTYA